MATKDQIDQDALAAEWGLALESDTVPLRQARMPRLERPPMMRPRNGPRWPTTPAGFNPQGRC